MLAKLRRTVRKHPVLSGTLGAIAIAMAWVGWRYTYAPPGEPLAALPGVPVSQVLSKSKRASILFVGDIHFGESYLAGTDWERTLRTRGYGHALEKLRTLLDSADIVIANLETPLTSKDSSSLEGLKPYVHWGDSERTVQALQGARVASVTLANNHSYDHLGGGLGDTFDALDGARVGHFGAGRSLEQAARPYRHDIVLGSRTVRMAVIGTFDGGWKDFWFGSYARDYASGSYQLRSRTISGQLRALKAKDPGLFVVVFPHWGKNYAWRSERQAELSRTMIDSGADLVLGHGAHAFQEVEFQRDKLVAHGLGNFVFLSPGRYGEYPIHPFGMAARLDLVEAPEGVKGTLVCYFLASDNLVTGFQPHVLDGPDFERAKTLLIDRGYENLRSRAKSGRDQVGPYVAFELGEVPASPAP